MQRWSKVGRHAHLVSDVIKPNLGQSMFLILVISGFTVKSARPSQDLNRIPPGCRASTSPLDPFIKLFKVIQISVSQLFKVDEALGNIMVGKTLVLNSKLIFQYMKRIILTRSVSRLLIGQQIFYLSTIFSFILLSALLLAYGLILLIAINTLPLLGSVAEWQQVPRIFFRSRIAQQIV